MAKKYEYEFVMIETSLFGRVNHDYQEIIQDYAQKGWRFVQIFYPISIGLFNRVSVQHYDLIFEREL